MLRKNVKSLLEQFQVCIFAEIVFGVRCTLRAVCCKDQLRSCNIEKTDFRKLCQNNGLGELVLQI